MTTSNYAAESRQRASASTLLAEGVASATHEASRTRPVGSPDSAGPFTPSKAPDWTEEETEALRRILPGSVSAAQVARDLSEEISRSVTRDAVIGRLWRLGLSPPWARKIWHPAEPTTNPFPDDVRGCLWPIGHPNDPQFHFCGQKRRVPDKPYCPVHAAKAYIKADKAVVELRPPEFYTFPQKV